MTIYAQSKGDKLGALNASGYVFNGAGIGGSDTASCGAITVNGGRITARGGGVYKGAGIGGGKEGSGGEITINGGIITATGGEGGPGICAGTAASDGGNIIIKNEIANDNADKGG